MGDPASTRPSLLIRIRDPGDAEAWGQFVALYGPMIYQFARKQGLQDADAADLTQIVLQAVIDAMKRLEYDPQRGSYPKLAVQGGAQPTQQVPRARAAFAPGQRRHRRASRCWTNSPTASPGRSSSGIASMSGSSSSGRASGCVPVATPRAGKPSGGRPSRARAPRKSPESLELSVGAVYTARSRILDRIRKEIENGARR